MIKRMLLMLLAFVVVLSFVGWRKYEGYKGFMAMKAGMAHMKQTISTTTATVQDWRPQLAAVGSIRAAKGVDISNELAGMVEEIHFNSGGDVKAGTLLVKLRAEDDIAKLASLEASERLAGITLARDKKQLGVQAISRATVDTDSANLQSARAQVQEQKAIVDKKFIRAPFSGHLGIRNVDMGQYLAAGTSIVTLQQLDPVYLDFTLPEQDFAQVKEGQEISVTNDTYPDREFPGKIAAISPKVDLTTRNIQVRAELPNADHALLPGMYATAKISIGKASSYVTLPQTAISYNPYGDTVFIVKSRDGKKDDLEADQVFVTVGKTRGDQIQILKGVNEGDVVVSSGQLKLQNGASVSVNNAVEPKNNPNPHPQEQ